MIKRSQAALVTHGEDRGLLSDCTDNKFSLTAHHILRSYSRFVLRKLVAISLADKTGFIYPARLRRLHPRTISLYLRG